MLRRALVLLVPIALMAGCSLIVDTSGLAEDAVSAPEAGEASSDANDAAAPPADAAADVTVDGGDAGGPCPSGRGPAMVRVTDTFGSFCIDATEVTNTQFNAFLADSTRPQAPSACAYRTSYGGAARPGDALPVTNVDWCEAWMFCAWSGKRLCGSRNGARINDFDVANDSKVSEWFAACSRSSSVRYPYGDTADVQRCNGCDRAGKCDAGGADLVATASLPCEGGYPGLFDMAGNVAEWEDNCAGGSNARQHDCPPRGGDRTLSSGNLRCELSEVPDYGQREDRSTFTGIRCCANPN